MLRTREPERVRADAIDVAVRKLRAGCEDCADRYFEIARVHGATESEIHSARLLAAKEEHDFSRITSRRGFLKVATLGAAGLAATVAPAPARKIVGDRLFANVEGAAPTATNMGWISAENQLLSLEPSGALGPTIEHTGGSAVRALGGTLLAVVASTKAAGRMNTSISLYAADSGQKQATVSGQGFDSHGAPEFWDAIALSVSPSGRLLAILHSTVTVYATGGTKAGPSPRILKVTYGIEIVDLAARESKAYISMPAESLLLPGAHVLWGRDDSRLYLFYLNAHGQGLGAKLAFDGQNLVTELVSVDSGTGLVLPNGGHAVPSGRATADGHSLARFTAPSDIEFIDLGTMQLSSKIHVPMSPSEAAKPTPIAVPLFDAGGRNLYLADGARGKVYVYDLETRSAKSTISLPVTDANASPPRLRWGHPGLMFRARLSPLGNQLLMIENRGSGSGIWSIDPSRAVVARQFASGIPLGAVSFSPDGRIIFALSYEHRSAVTLTSAGRIAGATQLGQEVIQFVGSEA